MPALIHTFIERGDLAHLALVLWAGSATALLYHTLRALFAEAGLIQQYLDERRRRPPATRQTGI